MQGSITNPEPLDNPAIRRRMHQLVAIAALLFPALTLTIVASFVDILRIGQAGPLTWPVPSLPGS
jgi:hypothetical protein